MITAEEARALLDPATPGTWWNESGVIHAPAWWPNAQKGAACHPASTTGSNGLDEEADAELIARAPDLAATVVTLTEQLAEVTEHRDQLGAQIQTLAEFIVAEIPGEPSQSQGAVHTAIRLLRTLTEQLAAAEARAWDEGSVAGWRDRTETLHAGWRGRPKPDGTPNPYRAQVRGEQP